MRKSILSLFLALLPAMILAQTFEIKYNLSDFTVKQGADSVVTISTAHRSFFSGDMQSPRLPFLSANILCSQGTVECDPVFRYEKEPIATGVLLHTIPPVYPTSIDPSTIDYTPQIARTSQSTPYNYAGVGKMMGYSFARISLSPFEYDYDTRTLYFIKSFVITLNERVQQRALSKSGIAVTPEPLGDPKFVSDIVLNSNELSTIYPTAIHRQSREVFRKGVYGQEDSSSYNNGDVFEDEMAEQYTVDYLVVTSTKLKSAFERLARWKRVRGLNPEIITVDNLTPLQVKEKIYNYYLLYNIKWVLLAGDEENIPINKIDNVASDLYYSCLDYNDLNQEFDYNDIYPDVHLSRLSVRDSVQAEDIIDKIIVYEQRDFLETKSDKIMFFGVTTIRDTYSDFYSNMIMDSIDPQHDDNTFDYCFEWRNNIGRGNDLSNNFKAILDSDYGIIHIDSHGTEKNLGRVNSVTGAGYVFYNIRDVESVSNSHPYIIVTNACLTNNFSSNVEPCLSEALMRKNNEYEGKGAIAYFGPSSNGRAFLDVAFLSGSYLYSTYFLQSILKDKKSIGEALTCSKSKCNASIDNTYIGDIYYTLTQTTNLLGDPELHFYTELLPKIDTEVCKVTADTVTVCLPAGQYGDAVVALYDAENEAGYLARKIGHAGETVSFCVSSLKSVSDPYSLRLVVSKNGYAPYIQDLFECRIIGDVVLNNNSDGQFSIQDLPEYYFIRWEISDTLIPESILHNYFSISNADLPNCNVTFNKVIDEEIYGLEKTSLSARINTCDIFRDYIQPVDGIDVVYLGKFTGNFQQESAGDYPGIPSTIISSRILDLYDEQDTVIGVIADSGRVELGLAPIKMSPRQMMSLSSRGVSPDKPIFVYPQGTVVLKSEFFKYLSYSLNESSGNAVVDFSKYNDGEIKFEMGEVNEVLSFKFERGGNVSDVYLNFVSVEFDSPSLVCINANSSNGIQIGLYSPEDMRSGSWVYEVYDASTAMLAHSETAQYSSSYTISYKPILNHSYVVTARNSDNNISLTARFIANF